MEKFTRSLTFSAAILALLSVDVARAEFPFEYFHREWNDARRALSNPGAVQAMVARIHRQLRRHSGKSFPVYPYQTNQIGRALPGGAILIDLSTLGKPPEVVAFWLAHEWAHQDLGHTPNIFSHPSQSYRAWQRQALYPTANEDDADVYAGRFLAEYGYDIARVLRSLCRLPSSPYDQTHSTGPQRALNVARAYRSNGGRHVASPCTAGPRNRPLYRREMCGPQYAGCAAQVQQRAASCPANCIWQRCGAPCGPYGNLSLCSNCRQHCVAACMQEVAVGRRQCEVQRQACLR